MAKFELTITPTIPITISMYADLMKDLHNLNSLGQVSEFTFKKIGPNVFENQFTLIDSRQ